MVSRLKKLAGIALLTATLSGCVYENIEPIRPKTLIEIIEEEFDYVRDILNSKSDGPSIAEDYWQSMQESIKKGTGDCEDYTIFLYYLLKEKGIKSEVVIGLLDSTVWAGHAWLEVSVNDTTYIIDATLNKITWRNDPAKGITGGVDNNKYYLYPGYANYAQRRLSEFYDRNKEYFDMKNIRVQGLEPLVKDGKLTFVKKEESGGRKKPYIIDPRDISNLPPIGN
ncbi:MAG TPA: transglutaminase-like domain-containing protein [Alphaproteobacteria bacterium]|nr:transglutaminase-like domain-containing protein [Alphaproteobacteria bacterium]